MKINKLLGILLVTMVIASHCYADNRGYLKIIFASKNAVPATQFTAARGQQPIPHYQLTFSDSNLNKVFAKYSITNFEKEYPIADSFPDDQTPAVHLRLVYKVLIDTTTGKSYDGLKQDIDTIHSTSIEITIRQYPSVNLATPNDYNRQVPGWPDPHLQLDLVNAIGAWNISTGLSCIKIGIVENNGNFQHHQDLDNKYVPSPNTAPVVSATNVDSHATLVAGVAGAETNNGIGISSLGYNISLEYYSFTQETGGYPQIVDAIHNKCKIINCSWFEVRYVNSGGFIQVYYSTPTYLAPSPDVQDVLNLAALNNVTIVAAAGNGTDTYTPPDDYVYPASYDDVISVTSVGSLYPVGDAGNYNWKDCHRQYFNPVTHIDSVNYLRFHNNNDRVDICAPGYSVTSTYNLGTSTATTTHGEYIGNGYAASGGTSFASPMVAAAAALLYSVNPFFTTAQVTKYLKDNAANIYGVYDNNTWAGKLGAGRLDAGASLQAAATNTYNGPTYCFGNAVNCPTQSTSITTNTILNQSKYFYNYDITAGTSGSGYVQTNTAAQTAFIATNSITLEAGFDANPSTTHITAATTYSPETFAYFTAYIEPCSGSVTSKETPPTKKALTVDNSSKGLQLYPNPATNEVHIFFIIAKDETATIKLTNNTGITLKTKSVVSSKDGSGNTVFDIKDIPAGVYYISLTSPKNKITKKLVKTNL